MKKFLILVLCCLSTGLCAQKDTLKVISYNIWMGFDFRKDVERQNKVINWLVSNKPDVVALQELCGYTEEKLLEDAKRWGHNYAILLKDECFSVGLTSVKPIVLKEKVTEDLWHGMLHCETFGVDFFVVHLSPADRDFRIKESKVILSKIASIGNNSFMVLGDFNAQSPFDGDRDIDYSVALETKRLGDFKNEKHNNLLDNEFDYSVMASFLASPLIDVIQRFVKPEERFTFPTKLRTGPGLSQEDKLRIDYIMVSRELAKKCSNSEVYNKEETTLFSDHYPLMAEFELDVK